jgi:hypothetical protein
MLVNAHLASLYHPMLGSKVGTGQRNLVVELGRKWVKMTNPYTLRSETIKRAVWDEAVASTVTPCIMNPRKLKEQLTKDNEAKLASYRLSLETAVKPYTPVEVERYVAARRKTLTAALNKVVGEAKASLANLVKI